MAGLATTGRPKARVKAAATMRSGGRNLPAYIHALVQGRGWHVEGGLGRIPGEVRGVDHAEGDAQGPMSGKTPFRTFGATMSRARSRKAPARRARYGWRFSARYFSVANF